MKYLTAVFLLVTGTALASPEKVGDFEIKRYGDSKGISKVLLTEINVLDEPTCVLDVIESPMHQVLLSSGYYIQAISLKKVEEDEEPLLAATFEYASLRPKEGAVIKKTVKCLISYDDPMEAIPQEAGPGY